MLVRVLLIGPLPIEGDVVGGTKVSFANLVTGLRKAKTHNIRVINSSRALRGRGLVVRQCLNAYSMVRLLRELWRESSFSQVVVWNVSPGGAIWSVALIRMICVLRNQRLIVRLFGGDFDDVYGRSSLLGRWAIDFFLFKADLILLQTHKLVEKFETRARVAYFPTTRDMPARTMVLSKTCRRFLFVGQLRSAKGINEILEASLHLPCGAEVTFVGPVMGDFDVKSFQKYPRIRYLGSLPPDDIPKIMGENDVFLFPSYYEGEGYPGVIVEALQSGLPVIATEWRAIPELVKHNENGLLIPPKSKEALLGAMLLLMNDREHFRALQGGAQEHGEYFRSVHAIERLECWINQMTVKE